MHIIIDIRTASPQDTMPIREGLAWARLWNKYKKEDILSFLMYEHQEKIDGFDCIIAPQHLGPFGKKHLRPRTGKEIFRSVSFSLFPLYDTSIPTILHIASNAHTFYPQPAESSWKRRMVEYIKKRHLFSASAIVVPDIQVGRELVELYDIDEGRIEIIPYIPIPGFDRGGTGLVQKIQTPVPYFIYDGGYGNEANLLGLFTAWEQYLHSGGKYQLLLLGSASSYLSELTQMLRSLEISESVRYLGMLDDGTLDELYRRASGWIYTGPYYGAGSIIELARAYDLPLLLSDIGALREYPGLHVHPNHIPEIAKALTQLEKAGHVSTAGHHEESYVQAYEKILSKKV